MQLRREPFSFLNGLHELPTSTSAQQFVKNFVREKYSRRAADREASNVEMCHRFVKKSGGFKQSFGFRELQCVEQLFGFLGIKNFTGHLGRQFATYRIFGFGYVLKIVFA